MLDKRARADAKTIIEAFPWFPDMQFVWTASIWCAMVAMMIPMIIRIYHIYVHAHLRGGGPHICTLIYE